MAVTIMNRPGHRTEEEGEEEKVLVGGCEAGNRK